MAQPDCIFCSQMARPAKDRFYTSPDGSFIAKWDYQPDVPGHALVIPKRHVVFFYELNQNELQQLAQTVETVKEIIGRTDLIKMYQEAFPHYANDVSRQRVEAALQLLKENDFKKPEGFNDAINDGPASDQTVHHLHWHVKPRWFGDQPELDE